MSEKIIKDGWREATEEEWEAAAKSIRVPTTTKGRTASEYFASHRHLFKSARQAGDTLRALEKKGRAIFVGVRDKGNGREKAFILIEDERLAPKRRRR